jgi:hypothetical protein
MEEWDNIMHDMDEKCEIVVGHGGKARTHEENAMIIFAINAKSYTP